MLTYQLVETDFDRKNMKSVHWRRTELAIDKRNEKLQWKASQQVSITEDKDWT